MGTWGNVSVSESQLFSKAGWKWMKMNSRHTMAYHGRWWRWWRWCIWCRWCRWKWLKVVEFFWNSLCVLRLSSIFCTFFLQIKVNAKCLPQFNFRRWTAGRLIFPTSWHPSSHLGNYFTKQKTQNREESLHMDEYILGQHRQCFRFP